MKGSATTRSAALEGASGRMIEIEVDIASGLPRTTVVGLPDPSVAQARDRCRAAVVNSSRSWPDVRVTINLAPASVPKSGSHYDLGIALATLSAAGVVPPEPLKAMLVMGELALDGRLRAVPGVLPAALAAVAAGCRRAMVPEVNAAEAGLVEELDVVGVRSLGHAVALLTDDEVPDDPPVEPLDATAGDLGALFVAPEADLADVVGQEEARISLTVAAAGGHHLWMVGPPGLGKTMLASRLPGLLPDLDRRSSLEVSAIHSVAGVLPAEVPLLTRPPFLDPHHSASAVSIVGGGSKVVRPGALSLAHRGVLFLDEAPEFASNVLDALRQPLESGHVVVSRAAQTVAFPARFQLVMASNPCPCGQSTAEQGACECTPLMRRRYRGRISGPIRDRLDIVRELSPASRHQIAAGLGRSRSTAETAELVAEARDRQAHRFRGRPWTLNSDVDGASMRREWPVSDEGQLILDRELRRRSLTPRGADRVVRLAWTVADVCGTSRPGDDEVSAALNLRSSLPIAGPLRERAA